MMRVENLLSEKEMIMKKSLFILLVTTLAFAGCSKKEEAAAQDAEMPPPPVVEEVVEEPVAEPEASVAEESPATQNALMAKVEEVKQSLPARKEVEEPKPSSLSNLASNLNWSNFTWDQVPEVSYANKEQLAVWAGSQVEEWKGKLIDSAKTQGLSMLSNLGDSGWQGALKDVMKSFYPKRTNGAMSLSIPRMRPM